MSKVCFDYRSIAPGCETALVGRDSEIFLAMGRKLGVNAGRSLTDLNICDWDRNGERRKKKSCKTEMHLESNLVELESCQRNL